MFSSLNYCGGIFSKFLSYLYEVVCPNFSPFEIFDRNFANVVSLSGGGNANCVVHLKGQSFMIKTMVKNSTKIDP